MQIHPSVDNNLTLFVAFSFLGYSLRAKNFTKTTLKLKI